MAKNVQPCGTEAAYRRHLRKQETPCEPCKRAAAKKRAQRRGVNKKPQADKTMRDILVNALEAILKKDDGTIDYQGEYERLYGYLNGALPNAVPREVSSIVREMRAILLEIRTLEVKNDSGNAALRMEEMFQNAIAGVELDELHD